MAEGEDSEQAKDDAENIFEELNMNVGESTREYVARAKGLANTVKFYNVEVADQEMSLRSHWSTLCLRFCIRRFCP